MDKLKQTLLNQLSHLKAKRIDAMRKAAEPYQIEIDKLEKILMLYDEVEMASELNNNQHSIASGQGLLQLWNNNDNLSPKQKVKKIGKNTQEMVIEILKDRNEGMLALDILKEINERWNLGLMRSSLSPQLSRLKEKGELKYNDGLWSLTSINEDENE